MEKIDKKIEEASQIIKDGGIVLFPTETVYGIGANAFNDEAVKKIFIAKGREQDNPLILHISQMEMLDSIAENISEVEYRLMDVFWPGPFTIILQKKEGVANVATCNGNTVGVRMPSNKIAHDFIQKAGVPIAAPSANISGKPSGTNLVDIKDELKDKVDFIIDGGETDIGLESTVVKVEGESVTILRPGKITKEEIESVVEQVTIDSKVMGSVQKGEKVLSPGMKYRHYAPKTKCRLVYCQNEDKMMKEIAKIAEKNENVVILCYEENIQKYKGFQCISMGKKNHLEEVSHCLFSTLRKIDTLHVDLAIIEGVEQKRIGTCYYESINTCM